MGKRICSIDGCERVVHGRGWCLTHYRRWQRHGDVSTVLVHRHEGDVRQRFWAKVDKTGDCWNWTASVNRAGYGKFVAGGKHVLAHRFAFELSSGEPVPDELQIDHRCHNVRCVRPAHLRLATPSQNSENYQPSGTRARSGVRGVDWCAQRSLWRARVQQQGKCVDEQFFATLEEAAIAVVAMRNRFHTYNDADRRAC